MSFSDRLNWAWRHLGLEGAVLLAALLGDLLIVFPAAFDDIGPKGRDLYLLPGILAMFACALWAKRRPAAAAFTAAAVLVGSTVLIHLTAAAAYSTLLNSLSLTETVAGLELVMATVRRERPASAFTSTVALTFAALFAVVMRSGGGHLTSGLVGTFGAGALLLAGAVAMGIRFRGPQRQRPPAAVTSLALAQWPLIGLLCLPLFLELNQTLHRGPWLFPLLLCSVAGAALAVYAARSPVLAAVLMSVTFLVSGVAGGASPVSSDRLFYTPPPTQVLAGMAIVVFLVRYTTRAQASAAIALMSVAVGLSVLEAPSVSLSTLFIGALLLLGISVAVGLYFRARDSERARAVEAAVTEAQTSERMALARELHDVVAHHVTGIVVQAQAAKMIGGQNPAMAMEALGRIEEAGTEALVAMRRLVGSMRSSTHTAEQATTDLEADLRGLVEAGHHGVPTEADLRISADVPQEVARSALRLVQESLTNVGKHAPNASRVHVLAETVGDELHIRVDNDGYRVDRPAGGSGGYGLVGMRERVELLHGRLTAGPVDGGWLVEAWLPLHGT
ncbi:two-component sensor histidine kinase [Amycolatopsis rhizosphaerae]|uniref:histidine kinase n=1 Tax=Amycolatopsis rhizosphaerae TaxID=2053003 RepID=A0A558CW48_9PSEU|nr:histidine kinase [Amycolatopsis rhizosphaerae]TVT52943.1 two-component sensor histidine kinase [Amycolatopsis rhizosphaerae]